MHLALRVDGGPEIGYGHLVRTGALAETVLGHGHTVTCSSTTPNVAASVYPDAVDVLPLDPATEPETFTDWIRREQPDVVLTDSYEVDREYQHLLDSLSPCLAVILDDTRHTVCADILINGNIYALNLEYEYEGNPPKRCLGIEYLLLREEIRTLTAQSAPWRDPPERVLVTMGGSDVRGVTPEVLPAFANTDLLVDVVIGPGFDEELEYEIERIASEVAADIRLSYDPMDLAERMFKSDLAVSAAGSTTYELLALDTPTIGIPQADNQIPIAEALSERGAMIHLPANRLNELEETIQSLVSDTEQRWSLRETGEGLIDGRGTERVYKALLRTVNQSR